MEQQRHHLSHSASSPSSSSSSSAFDSTGKHKSFSLVSSLRLFYLRTPFRAILLLLVVALLLAAFVVLTYYDDSYSFTSLSNSLPHFTSPALSHATPTPDTTTSPSTAVSLFLDPSIPLSTLSAYSLTPIQIDRLVYTTASTSSTHLPQFIQSFRAGHLDWHRLLPAIPPTSSAALDFEHLVASERATTKLLVYDYNLHSRWQWGQRARSTGRLHAVSGHRRPLPHTRRGGVQS